MHTFFCASIGLSLLFAAKTFAAACDGAGGWQPQFRLEATRQPCE